MKVIVNADDLGMTHEVNNAVFELMAAGRVTSATVMANGVAAEQAARRAKEFPQCSFGIHLNATEFEPLTNGPGLAPVLDSSGFFAGNRIREVALGHDLRQALFDEWCAQVERVRDAGISVSHFDGHHHVHTIPGLLPVLKRLQRKFGIRRVRISMNLYPTIARVGLPSLLKKAAWNLALRRYFRTSTTDGFTSLATFVETATVSDIQDKFRTIELMVHPGGLDFADESALLASEWWRKFPGELEFISYNEL